MQHDPTCERIKLLLSDVDGVMTSGGVTYSDRSTGAGSIESKTFNIKDGLGIRLWIESGGKFGVVTGRASAIVERRAEELGIEIVRQGVSDKAPVVRETAESLGLAMDEVAYLGDDLPDLAPIREAGFGVAVADAVDEVRRSADWVTTAPGGAGAVRELVEHLLKHSGRWGDALAKY
ncbi:3-deoxy-D-manno-octulosonate 8-phosphate phosphatase KdsC [Pseudobythopirellula maris]|uniref:3-deoxy-D-manno-octulosonate 8-phosphate phosphatase KdsC n=1 Tax=Pseudobythopirellula maris TaxID=2527991 RepID=A0A5C5ZSC9_9BACT|nr:HAD hydrolase family protein [Pseudobythopirellula maris]TWT89671.1 3-deoxy-D-manno-octulosonate 8-phosphate phosphatase KdsC [Pseudobythopirellula maris]